MLFKIMPPWITGTNNLGQLSAKEMETLVRELKDHQIALEMRNEELQRSQEALEALQTKYVDLYDLAPVGYITVDAQGLIQEANLTAATLLGLSRGSLCGRPLTRFILPEAQDIHYSYRKKLFETGNPQACELWMVRKDGTRLLMRLEATLGTDTNTGAAVCRATLSDVTERRTLEAAVAQMNRLSSMGLLAAGLAHEINNPLTYMLYSLETLAKRIRKLTKDVDRCRGVLSKLPEITEIPWDSVEAIDPTAFDDLAQYVDAALSGAHQIKETAKGLSFFSRVDEARPTTVEINQAVEHAISMTSNETKYRATVIKDFGNVPPIAAAKGKLAQVFLNLIINAALAIDEGAAKQNQIRIRTWAQGNDAFAEVTDTGRGIPANHLERIFDPLFTAKMPGHDIGFGLAISHRIVTELGGEIRAESVQGEGSRFVVRLPISEATPASIPHRRVDPSTARGRILIVEDEETVRTVLEEILTMHNTVLVASGEEGQAVIEQDAAFDIVLCDLMMPRMTGMDFHAWLVEHHPTLAKKTVFITGGVFTPRASAYLADTDNPVIQKPFDMDTLQRVILEMLTAKG
ncbi:MAG: ATP-binding protein [Myxococcota bacterium]|nr:ATP-binding protein [Myxococcota bacterium]